MTCPQCGSENEEDAIECIACLMPFGDHPTPEQPDGQDLDFLIRTGLTDPIAIGFARCLLDQAGIPFFAMDQNPATRQEGGNFLGWWSVRVPHAGKPKLASF